MMNRSSMTASLTWMGHPFLNAPFPFSAVYSSPVTGFLRYPRRMSESADLPTARDIV